MIPIRDTTPSLSPPIVTVALIVVNVLIFLFEVSLDPFSRNHLIAQYGVVPDRIDTNYLSIVTSMFLHGGWMHVIGNMWFLWIFGDNVEDILGHGKFLLFYLLCGIAAALGHIALNPDSRIPTIGASGAIAGVMGAYMVKFPRSSVLTLIPIFFFVTWTELPAYVILAYWFVIQFFSGVGSVAYSHLSQEGVAWFAHVAGFIAGIVLIYVLGSREKYGRTPHYRW